MLMMMMMLMLMIMTMMVMMIMMSRVIQPNWGPRAGESSLLKIPRK